MTRLQRLTLMLSVSALPHTMAFYCGLFGFECVVRG